ARDLVHDAREFAQVTIRLSHRRVSHDAVEYEDHPRSILGCLLDVPRYAISRVARMAVPPYVNGDRAKLVRVARWRIEARVRRAMRGVDQPRVAQDIRIEVAIWARKALDHP